MEGLARLLVVVTLCVDFYAAPSVVRFLFERC